VCNIVFEKSCYFFTPLLRLGLNLLLKMEDFPSNLSSTCTVQGLLCTEKTSQWRSGRPKLYKHFMTCRDVVRLVFMPYGK
jgi:hypothetical protein